MGLKTKHRVRCCEYRPAHGSGTVIWQDPPQTEHRKQSQWLGLTKREGELASLLAEADYGGDPAKRTLVGAFNAGRDEYAIILLAALGR